MIIYRGQNKLFRMLSKQFNISMNKARKMYTEETKYYNKLLEEHNRECERNRNMWAAEYGETLRAMADKLL